MLFSKPQRQITPVPLSLKTLIPYLARTSTKIETVLLLCYFNLEKILETKLNKIISCLPRIPSVSHYVSLSGSKSGKVLMSMDVSKQYPGKLTAHPIIHDPRISSQNYPVFFLLLRSKETLIDSRKKS